MVEPFRQLSADGRLPHTTSTYENGAYRDLAYEALETSVKRSPE